MPTGKRNVRIAQTAGEDISCRLLAVGEFMLSWPLHRETSAEIPDGVTRRRRTGEALERHWRRERRKGMEQEWYLIAGLGNPGKEYDGSRHNVGFEVADRLIDAYRIDGPTRFRKSLVGKGRIGDAKVIVMKPLTYMNLSGEAVREALDYYKIDAPTHLIVISDDIDLAPGQLRLRAKGSAGGHNGLKNIMQHVGDGNFMRVRVGVGAKPNPEYNLADHVLGHPTGEDRRKIDEAMDRAAEAVSCILEEGIQKAMNRYNG